MENPVIHVLVFLAAVIIPGGLLVYFAWRAARPISLKGEPNQTGQNDGFDVKDEEQPTPEEALDAFLRVYPKYSQDSLRARSRANRLRAYKSKPRKKSQ